MSTLTINEKNIVGRECGNCKERPVEGPIVGRSKTSKKRKKLSSQSVFFPPLSVPCAEALCTLIVLGTADVGSWHCTASGCDHWLFLLVRYAHVYPQSSSFKAYILIVWNFFFFN